MTSEGASVHGVWGGACVRRDWAMCRAPSFPVSRERRLMCQAALVWGSVEPIWAGAGNCWASHL